MAAGPWQEVGTWQNDFSVSIAKGHKKRETAQMICPHPRRVVLSEGKTEVIHPRQSN
jgi:hypothetical protein